MDDVLQLPPTMDAAHARGLFDELSRRRGTPLTVDVAGVERVSALVLEVLIASKRQWQADGVPFALSAVPDALSDALTGLGLKPHFDAWAQESRETGGGAA